MMMLLYTTGKTSLQTKDYLESPQFFHQIMNLGPVTVIS